MKHIIYTAIAGLLLISSIATFAQKSQKFGHIDSAELLEMMPEIKVADAELKQFQQDLEDQNQIMLTDYQKKLGDYEKNKDSMSAVQLEVTVQEIQDMEGRIQNFQQTAPDKLTSKKEELYNPIIQKAQNAIQEVAKENGYTYIFDTSLGVLIEYPDSDDLLDLVKKKMNF